MSKNPRAVVLPGDGQQLGSRVALTTSPARVINWRSPNGEPSVVTVTLVPILNPSSPDLPVLVNSLFPFRADVVWGHGAVDATAQLDYPVMGGTFTIAASSVTVMVSAEGVSSWAPGQTFDPGVQFGAFMSVGASRPDRTPPTWTRQQDNADFAPTGGIIAVPRFARAYYVQDNVDNSTFGADQQTWRIDCQNRGLPYPNPGGLSQLIRVDTQMVVAADEQRLGPTLTTPFPLPPRCTHLQLVKLMAPVPNAAMVVFILDLGA